MILQKALHEDALKPPLAWLSRTALEEVAKVLLAGEKKYARDNWRKGMEWTRVTSSALRHIYAFLDGEDLDKESGLSHISHAACNLMFLLEYIRKYPKLDDRYK